MNCRKINNNNTNSNGNAYVNTSGNTNNNISGNTNNNTNTKKYIKPKSSEEPKMELEKYVSPQLVSYNDSMLNHFLEMMYDDLDPVQWHSFYQSLDYKSFAFG
jgi:hypothetical protein